MLLVSPVWESSLLLPLRLGPPVLGTHAGGHAVLRVVKQATIHTLVEVHSSNVVVYWGVRGPWQWPPLWRHPWSPMPHLLSYQAFVQTISFTPERLNFFLIPHIHT